VPKTFAFMIWYFFLTANLFACAGGDYWNYVKDESYDFFDPTIIGVEKNSPLLYLSTDFIHPTSYTDRTFYYDETKKKLNIKEWMIYFHNKASVKEIETMLYDDYDGLSPIGYYKTHLNTRINNPQFEAYLVYLTKQIPYVTRDMYTRSIIDQNAYKQIMTEGESLFHNTKEPFLKLRYLYLLMRFYHYNQDYSNVIKLYRENISWSDKQHSIVNEWTKSLYAGALIHTGEEIEANRLFASCIDHKTNAYLALYDFSIKNDEQWNNLLSSTGSNDEKAKYYFLRAFQGHNSLLHEHRQISSFAPESIWFERLGYVILQDLQAEYYREKSGETQSKSYVEKKRFFLQTLKALKKPAFFDQYAEQYLNVIENKPIDMNAIRMLDAEANSEQHKFVVLLKYLNHVNTLKVAELEKLYQELFLLKPKFTVSMQESLVKYTALRVAEFYPNKSIGFELLNTYNIHYDSYTAEGLETFWFGPKRSMLEQYVLDHNNKIELNQEYQIIATRYIRERKYDKAIEYLRKIPKDQQIVSDFNPFNTTLSGNNRSGTSTSMTQLRFAEIMKELYDKVGKNPKSVQDHLLIANGLYNQSMYGNFPSSSYVYYLTWDRSEFQKDLDFIKNEYLLTASLTTDQELKAKIGYELLKVSSMLLELQAKNEDVSHSEAMAKLYRQYQSEYQHTRVGQQNIKGCATFQSFL
jgi:hypothetical protein